MCIFAGLLSECVCVREGTLQIARDACSFPNVATRLRCAVLTFHAPDSALTGVIPAAKKSVSVNKQLLGGIQVSADRCQLPAPQAAQNYAACSKHLPVSK